MILGIALLAGVVGYKIGTTQVSVRMVNLQPRVEVVNKLPSQPKSVDFSLFWKVWDELTVRYVDKSKLDPQKMLYGAISGMVAGVGDPYTMFLPPTQNKESKEDLNGKFEGIGASLELKNGRVVVSAPLSGSPAEKAGIRALDWIVKVDGKETAGWSLVDAVSKIRGPKGTKVALTIVHNEDPKPTDVTITRDTIILKSVEWRVLDGKTVYVKLARFGDETQKQWDESVLQIERYAATQSAAQRLILDLRNNPGGLLSQSVYIASEFLPVESGVVVKQQSSAGEAFTYSVNRRGRLLEIPLVILVNQGTASASEILAGALQVAKRATVVGAQSFGKGSVQEVEDYPGGAGLHVTVAKWLLANDVWINGTGLTPDVKIENETNSATSDAQLNRAIQVFK